ncbi:hypothetical protein DE4587_01900 [Mycobacteroides salmoniphilum]|nr:hypothetical protein DE4586_03058 [Mycobacteroides salmoniphilum]TDZ86976.1 hypothetical protein DE4587_01900 [Mycobacteroides salmoniphilum]
MLVLDVLLIGIDGTVLALASPSISRDLGGYIDRDAVSVTVAT